MLNRREAFHFFAFLVGENYVTLNLTGPKCNGTQNNDGDC